MATKTVSLTSPTDVDAQAIARRRAMAEALQSDAMQPIQAPSYNGLQAPISWTQGLAKMLQAHVSRQRMDEADADQKALLEQQQSRRGADMGVLVRALQGDKGGIVEDASGNITETSPQSSQQMLGNAIPLMSPEMQGIGLQTMLGDRTAQQQREFQATEARTRASERAEAQRVRDAEAAERQRRDQAFRDEQARLAATDRENLSRLVAGNRPPNNPIAVMGPDGKPMYVPPDQAVGKQPWSPRHGGPMPASALTMQNEMLEQIGIAGAIDADLASLEQQVSPQKNLKGGQVDPALQVGPVRNLFNQAKNMAGFSDAESQNFASFKSTLEKLRNDSLRLNKGVQTEGDAQRAWNELMANITDQGVVQKRLQEIRKINQRASQLKRLQIDTLRSNFGQDSLDVAPFSNQPSAIGGAPTPAAGGAPAVDPIREALKRAKSR